jgi:hypothetical protein
LTSSSATDAPIPDQATALAELRRRHRAYVAASGDRFAHCPFSCLTHIPGWTYYPLEDKVERDPAHG